MKRIVILGAGESGAGAAVLAKKEGFDVFVSDMSAISDKYKKMLDDRAAGCPVMRFDVSTLNTLPETEFFAGFAGWSIGFKIMT
jgi:UDP-N-acetylmuramoylalanine-D-glutamate ligase